MLGIGIIKVAIALPWQTPVPLPFQETNATIQAVIPESTSAIVTSLNSRQSVIPKMLRKHHTSFMGSTEDLWVGDKLKQEDMHAQYHNAELPTSLYFC